MPVDVPAATESSRPGLLALALLVVAVIGFVTVLSRLPVDPSSGGPAGQRSTPHVSHGTTGFDFYRVLTGAVEPTDYRPAALEKALASHRPATRVVPGRVQHTHLPAPGGAAGSTVYPGDSYYLQAGIFTEVEAAERRRAAVLLLGLDAFIVSRQESDGALGHRVRIGPYRDLTGLSKARQRLQRGQLEYEIVRVTG